MHAIAVDGDWVNELGSQLTLNVGPNNNITGSYSTAVGDDKSKNKIFPLVGKLHFPLVSFIVDYETSDSVTAWIGMISEQKNPTTNTDETVIKTVWLMGSSYTGSKEERRPAEFWEAFNINHDTFRRT